MRRTGPREGVGPGFGGMTRQVGSNVAGVQSQSRREGPGVTARGGVARGKERHPEGGARFQEQGWSSPARAFTGELGPGERGGSREGCKKGEWGGAEWVPRTGAGRPESWGRDQERSYTRGHPEGRTPDEALA